MMRHQKQQFVIVSFLMSTFIWANLSSIKATQLALDMGRLNFSWLTFYTSRKERSKLVLNIIWGGK